MLHRSWPLFPDSTVRPPLSDNDPVNRQATAQGVKGRMTHRHEFGSRLSTQPKRICAKSVKEQKEAI